MSYREKERKRAIHIRESLLKEPGMGMFFKKKREFVLSNPQYNLWAGIREDAIAYFKKHKICWWESQNEPTGHLLSSQIACLNHLYFLRQRQDIATAVLKNIGFKIKKACIVDDGFVEFEMIGKNKYLPERSHIRGKNTTSIDALMVGEQDNGKNILIFIEWKYTEFYNSESLAISAAGTSRINTYRPLLERSDCPIRFDSIEDLFFDPYDQLMRQTLLAWRMVDVREYGATDWVHLHIIPRANKELKDNNTSISLIGKDMSSCWKSVLKDPNRYLTLSPEEFLKPALDCTDVKSLMDYLKKRYWEDNY